MKKDAVRWIKITQAKLNSLPPPTRKQDIYRDTERRGFGVIVGTKKKSFFVERRVDGRNRRRVLTGSLHPEAARKKAEQWLARMSEGSDPNPRRRSADGAVACLHDALEGYIGRRALKPNTAREYRRIRDTSSVTRHCEEKHSTCGGMFG